MPKEKIRKSIVLCKFLQLLVRFNFDLDGGLTLGIYLFLAATGIFFMFYLCPSSNRNASNKETSLCEDEVLLRWATVMQIKTKQSSHSFVVQFNKVLAPIWVSLLSFCCLPIGPVRIHAPHYELSSCTPLKYLASTLSLHFTSVPSSKSLWGLVY
jgi:hypothetical protein